MSLSNRSVPKLKGRENLKKVADLSFSSKTWATFETWQKKNYLNSLLLQHFYISSSLKCNFPSLLVKYDRKIDQLTDMWGEWRVTLSITLPITTKCFVCNVELPPLECFLTPLLSISVIFEEYLSKNYETHSMFFFKSSFPCWIWS